jgi:hypothetical protein
LSLSFRHLGAPTRPEGPLKVKDVTKNGAKLTWDKPEDDGGTPVSCQQVTDAMSSVPN